MNAGKEKALDEEQKLDGNVFHTSLYDNLMQDIDAVNWEKATNMILAPITVNDMLKFLSEDLRTNIEKVVESGAKTILDKPYPVGGTPITRHLGLVIN